MKTPMPPTLVRWLRFNSVGAIGSLVQLVALALIDRLVPHHTLLVTAAALELTLLHNFFWHRRWTWRSNAGRQPWLTPLVRFHVSNGLVSLAGNLVVMRLLVTQAHLPLLASNGIAMIVCSLANFWLGSVWAFAADSKSLPKRCLHRAMSAPCPPNGCIRALRQGLGVASGKLARWMGTRRQRQSTYPKWNQSLNQHDRPKKPNFAAKCDSFP